MIIEKRRSLAGWIGIVSAIGVIACTGYLILSYLQATRQAAADKILVESMEEAVKLDASVSVDLTAERERQTQRALERSRRTDRVATVLVIGAALFLASMNWRMSLAEETVLTFERLQRLRSASAVTFRVPDTRLWNLEPTEAPRIDLSFVERLVQEEGRAADAAIPIMRAIQLHYGYLPDEALKKVCELTEITPSQIAGTSTFYAYFRRSPVGRHLLRICHGTACHVSGAVQVTEEVRRYLSIPPDADTDPSRFFTLEKVACLGCCGLAPVMMIDDRTVGRLTPTEACYALASTELEQPA